MLTAGFFGQEPAAAVGAPDNSFAGDHPFSPGWKINLGRFGDYELLEEIAHGGMGVVYRARQISLRRLVAVKMLLLGQFSSSESIQRFRREAAAAASLQHPNIVAIHEIGSIDGQEFFSMDYVEGQSLAALIRERPLAPATAAIFCQSIASAISYAHGRGIIHRDLKPSNVVIDLFEQVRITDFGLAKQLDGSADLTVTGHLLGSPNYFPPEIASGRQKVSAVTSDLYSIGAILYECLTGRPPFLAESIQETLLKIRDSEVPSPRLLQPKIPRALETICLKCLEKIPGNRYATAEALAHDLGRFLAGEPIQARAVTPLERGWRFCRRKPALASFMGATGFLMATLMAGSLMATYRINQLRKSERAQRERAEAQALQSRLLAYAADMNLAQEAFKQGDLSRTLQLLNQQRPATNFAVLDRAPEADLRGWEWRYLWSQCQGEESFVLGSYSNGVSAVGFLPDGKTAFSAGRDKLIRFWNIQSRAEVGCLRQDDPVTGAVCSPDGHWLASNTQTHSDCAPVRLWDIQNSREAVILATNFWLRPNSTVFSPDSSLLAFVDNYEGVRLWDVTTRREIDHRPAYFQYSSPLGLAFSPDGLTLAYNENKAGDIVLWDIRAQSVIKRLKGHARYVTSLAFTPDGKLLLSGSNDKTVRLWDVASGREERAFNYTVGIEGLRLSPDGKILATAASPGGQRITLQEIPSGREVLQLRGHIRYITDAAFSPDGRMLISGSGDGTVRLWDVTPEAKHNENILPLKDLSPLYAGSGTAVSLSPDGEHLLTVFTNHTFSICATRALTQNVLYPVPTTRFACAGLASGGKMAAFVDEDGSVFLWKGERGESNTYARPTTRPCTRALFSADGKRLAIGGVREVCVLDLSNQKQPRSFSLREDESSRPSDLVMALTFSPDSQKIIAGFYYGLIKVWDLSGTNEMTLKGGDDQVHGLILLPDGRTLASVSSRELRFWDLELRQHSSFRLPSSTSWSGSVSRDGRRLAIGGSEGFITILDLASRQIVTTLIGHEQPVLDLSFLSDGKTLVSAGDDELRVWSAALKSELHVDAH
jgi:WD40 repeat protein